jgi:hypothetical protein
MLQADLQPGLAGAMQCSDNFSVIRIVNVIIADPGLEEVAKNVQCFSLTGAPGQKLEKQTSRPG